MTPERLQDPSRPRLVSPFEERWSRRVAVLVVAVGLAGCARLMWDGYTLARGESEGPLVSCATLVERCFDALMRNAEKHPSSGPPQISPARMQQMVKDFKQDSPVYRKLFGDVVQHLEWETRGKEVHDNPSERDSIVLFLGTRYFRIEDADWVANLDGTPEGRRLIATLKPGAVSPNHSSIVVPSTRVLTHYPLFLDLGLDKITAFEGESDLLNKGTIPDPEP
jgi:hypothetical protein